MKKSSLEKHKKKKKIQKRKANFKKNSKKKLKKSKLKQQQIALNELKKIEEYEKEVYAKISDKLKETSDLSIEEQKEFIRNECLTLTDDSPKTYRLKKHLLSMLNQLELADNLNFLIEYWDIIKSDEKFNNIIDLENHKIKQENIDEIVKSYIESLESDNKKYVHPEVFFEKIKTFEVNNLDTIKFLWCLYMESQPLNEVNYLITLIVKKVLLEDKNIIEDFKKLGEYIQL